MAISRRERPWRRIASELVGCFALVLVQSAGAASASTITAQSIVSTTLGSGSAIDSGVQSGNPANATESTVFTNAAYTATWNVSSDVTAHLAGALPGLGAAVSIDGTSVVGQYAASNVTSKALAHFVDRVTPTGLSAPAHLVVPFTLTGAVTIDYTLASGFAPPFVVTFAGNWCSAQTSSGTNLGGCGFSFTSNHASGLSWNANGPTPVAVNETAVLDVPLLPGESTDFDLGFTVQALMNGPLQSGYATLTGKAVGDFSHTGVFGPAMIVDALGQPLQGVGLSSDSGFDYLTATMVPEPDTEELLAAGGMLGLLVLRRRREDPRALATPPPLTATS